MRRPEEEKEVLRGAVAEVKNVHEEFGSSRSATDTHGPSMEGNALVDSAERQRPKLFDLINDVVHGGSCSECGACVVACPYGILTYEQGKPQAWDPGYVRKSSGIAEMIIKGVPQDFCPISENVGCDCCAYVCPKLELPKERLEHAMFGRRAQEDEQVGLGVYQKIEFTRTRDPRVRKVCQDGGFVTTLLIWALRTGLIDGAVLTTTDPNDPCKPRPFVATTEKEILKSSGSWYTYSPNTLGLIEAYEMGLRRVAFVGTPCQITPLRKLQVFRPEDMARIEPNERNFLHQYAHLEKFRNMIAFLIGLFCSETFTYEGLMKGYIEGKLGIPRSKVTKFNIKGKVIVTVGEEEYQFPLADAVPFARPECSFCGDFSAEEADIAVGGVGTAGWTLTMPRTAKGLEIYEALKASQLIEVKPATEFSKSVAVARKLAQKQRNRMLEAYRKVARKPPAGARIPVGEGQREPG